MNVPAQRARLRQVTGLDGLRGLAVLAVIVYHFFGDLLPGGYLGVDMFFVLSGFLITSLLLREFAVTNTISLKDFWIRRFRRILPAAMVVLFTCTAVVGLVGAHAHGGTSDLAVGIREQFLGTAFFVNNWVQIATNQSYFADNEIQVFAHYWSLAVEEQFYLIWPLVVIALLMLAKGRDQARGRRKLGILTVVLAVASLVGMAVLYDPSADPTRVYYGTDTHAFGLLIGALLATLLTSSSPDPYADSWPSHRRFGWIVKASAVTYGSVALVLYLAQLFLMGDDLPVTYRGGLFATSVLGAIMIWAVVREAQPLHLIFSTAPMRYLGQRSFSLYLWHWPVVIILDELFGTRANGEGLNSWWIGIMAAVVSFALAEGSYRLIENPFRRKGYKQTMIAAWRNRPFAQPAAKRKQFSLAASYVVAFVAVSATLLGTANAVVNSSDKTQLESDLEQLANGALPDGANQALPPTPTPEPEPEITRLNPTPKGPEITAIGDSVMLASSAALQQRFPGISIDAAVSRHYNAGVPIIQSLKDQGLLRKYIFLGFGTNGATTDAGELEQILAIAGEDRVLFIATPYGDRVWMPPARQEIVELAKEHDNVFIADWCTHALNNPAILREDYIHPTLEGATEYATAFYYASLQYAFGGKKTTTGCV